MAPTGRTRGRPKMVDNLSASTASSRHSSITRSGRRLATNLTTLPQPIHPSRPLTVDDDIDDEGSAVSPQRSSNIPSKVASKDNVRDSLSSVTSFNDPESSGYSTPATSAVATPALQSRASVARRGRGQGLMTETTPGVSAILRAAALRNSGLSLNTSRTSKRKRAVLSDDEDSNQDNSADAQLARALQQQEDDAAAIPARLTSQYSRRRTPRKVQKIRPKTDFASDFEDDDFSLPQVFSPKLATRPKIELGSGGSNGIKFTPNTKSTIQDSEASDDFEDQEGSLEIDDSEADSSDEPKVNPTPRGKRTSARSNKPSPRKMPPPRSTAPKEFASTSNGESSSRFASSTRKQQVSSASSALTGIGSLMTESVLEIDSDSDLSLPPRRYVESDSDSDLSRLLRRNVESDSELDFDDDSGDDSGAPLQQLASRAVPSTIGVGSATARRRRMTRIHGESRLDRRARLERGRLLEHHPELNTMWTDLENLPKIGSGKIEQPDSITRELKPFQLEGVAWMKAMEETEWGGGLLGDEMGMGKTIQAVTLIMSDFPNPQPSLVLIPPVALMQWQQEIADYTNGTLKTFVFHGTNSKTKGVTVKELKNYNVILMSYNSLESMWRKQEKGFKRKDGIHIEKSVIHQIQFHRVILDEAHSIKSRTSGSAKACFALKADHKWCLSGTPLQNRIGEFFSLVRFLDIKPFACYFCKQCPCSTINWDMDDNNRCKCCKHSGMQHVSVFNQELLNPIVKYGNNGAGKEAFRKLRLLTDRFMLRRVKRDHSSAMELPAKEIYVDRQFFGEEENDFASSIMNNSNRKFETYVAQGVMLNNYANIFGLIMQMRQVADHPDLILKKNGDGGQNILVCCICDDTAEEAIRSSCRHDFCRECAKNYLKSTGDYLPPTVIEGYVLMNADIPDCPQCNIPLSIDLEQPEIEQDEQLVKKSSIINRIKMENWTSSSKIEALVHDLYQLRSKNSSSKSIIFSQFTTMLQLVEWRLRRAGITTVMLDGSMTPAQRQASINKFMTNVNVECFLVSLKAGGVALNLTEASKVFIVDPWWNPAAEWQSADRCHRIGQARPCSITRLCIEDSVESRMVLLQEKKANMINSTINADESAMESLTAEDMQFLFRGN